MHDEVQLCLSGSPHASLETPPAILRVLATLLEQQVSINSQYVHWTHNGLAANEGLQYGHPGVDAGPLTVFHGLRAPTISVSQYLERIHKYAKCSPACFTLAYIYISRLCQRQPDILITSLSCHRLVITSILVAAKWLDDAFFTNAYYGQVGGVTTKELNRMELEFLLRINFDLNVTVDTLQVVEAQLACQLGAMAPPRVISSGHSSSSYMQATLHYGSPIQNNCHRAIAYGHKTENDESGEYGGYCMGPGTPASAHQREFAPLTPERTYMAYS